MSAVPYLGFTSVSVFPTSVLRSESPGRFFKERPAATLEIDDFIKDLNQKSMIF